MNVMATRVELTTRNTRSDTVNEGKSTKSYVIPLSDASNKSSDSSISSSLLIDETLRVPSKPVSMFNTGLKPRLSPKPFTKEKPPENRRTVGMMAADMTSESDVPFQTSASISLSGSTKMEDTERVGRRIFTSSFQPDPEVDQLNNSEHFSPTILNRKQTSSSWRPTDIGESMSTSETKVTSKPPLMSRKPDVLQHGEKVHAASLGRISADSTDEQKETPEKAKNNSFQSESMDILTVRAQLRPKRRPVSAMFLESVNDQTSDSTVTEKPRRWNRRPLSEDLTSVFESGGVGNKQESIFEETKENIPVRKNSLNSSFKEDQSVVTSTIGDYNNTRNTSNETRTIGSKNSSRNIFSGGGMDDTISEIRSRTMQGKTGATGVESTVKGLVNNDMQDSNPHDDYTDGSSSETKASEDNGVTPGTMKNRISRYLANTSPSLDLADSPTSKDKHASTVERKTRTTSTDNDMEFGRLQTTSQYQMASVSKKFLTSSSNVEPKSEKADEEKNTPTSQDIEIKKEKKDWRTSDFSEDKFLRSRRSFRKVEEPLQPQDNAYKSKLYDNKTEEAEDQHKQPVNTDNTFRTVKATMFDHNVEWHRPPELLNARNLTSTQPARSDISSVSTESKKDTESWSKWLSGDSVHAVTQLRKDSDLTEIRFSNNRVGQAAPAADHDILQKLKVDEKTRIEPRFEVIQAVGERVSSESIQMAPEDKAVTLRSRRSFHRKEKVLEDSEKDESVLRRPASSLQRSKSEYRKKDTSSEESPTYKFVSRDLDFPFNRKNSLRTAKSDLIKSPDIRTYETGKKSTVDATVSDLRSKSYIRDFKPKQENVSEQCPVEQSPFGIGATDGKDMRKSLNDYSQHSHRSFIDSVEKRLETGARTVKDGPVGSYSITREDIKTLPHVEVNKQSYERNRFLSNKESPATKKENKDESNYLISEMLSNEVEQFKKDLTATQTRKDSDSFLKGIQFKEEYIEQWDKKKVPVQDRGTENSADLYNFKYETYDERKSKPSISPISATNSKATYFAVTGLDNKKEKNDSNFESQSSAARSWTSEEYFKRDIRVSTTSGSDSSSNRPEVIKTQEDLGTSSAFKESKNHRSQRVFEDDFIGKPVKKNDIDIDALLKRHKQKTSTDDKLSYSRDTKTEHKVIATDLDTTQGSPLKLDGSYKSKAVDIDSLMVDYNAPTKESRTRDDDYSTTKWERSKSFKESASKSSGNKWRDPSVKHDKKDESYQYETVASWYSSFTTTSKTEGTPQDSHKISSSENNLKSIKDVKYEEYREKRRDQGFQVPSEERRNIASLDPPQEPGRNFENYKSRPTWATESPSVISDRSSLRTVDKATVGEKSVDDPKDESAALKVHHKISVKTDRTSILTEERQSPSEGRGPARASDLISSMLEKKERRMEHHRARQSIPVEHQYEARTHRQEWHHSESKNYFEKETSSPLKQDLETVINLERKKSLHRQREWDSRLEDNLKQCFSRSSTSNKDTDSLVQDPERQYGTWSQDKQPTEDSCVTDSPSYDNSSRRHHSHSRLSSLSHTETDQHDSITEARDGSLDRCSMDLDSIEGTESTPSEGKSADFSFIDQTSVLDSTALKNRVQLSRKSQRRAPSQLQRRSRLLQSSSQLAVIEDTDNLWMYSDSTEEKPEKKEEPEEEEEKPKRTSVHSPRMPVFPGMDHSTLMAQLRKRQDAESSSESSPQVTKSPKSPLPHGTLGVKLLPTPADKQDNAAGESPQWLKELKSKKRQSQYENHS